MLKCYSKIFNTLKKQKQQSFKGDSLDQWWRRSGLGGHTTGKYQLKTKANNIFKCVKSLWRRKKTQQKEQMWLETNRMWNSSKLDVNHEQIYCIFYKNAKS